MAHPCAAIDIVGADHRADKLLHQVVLLVGTPRRGNSRYRIRAVTTLYGGKFFGYVIVGLIPCGGLQFTISADKRRLNAIGMVVKREGKTSFQTGVALVYFSVIRRLDGFYFAVYNCNLQIATHAAISAYRSDFLVGHHAFAFKNIRNGTGRTSLCAGAATHTVAFEKVVLKTLDDVAIETATSHAEHQLALHLVAGAYTAIAIDTLRKIGGHIWMAQIFGLIQVIFPVGIAHVADAHSGSHRLQLAIVVHFAGEAV